MKSKKILPGLLAVTTMFTMTMPSVFAQTYNVDSQADNASNYEVDTSYESREYEAPIETYDIDINWDDLHWVFVYEGDITEPTREVWVTKENYNTISENEQLTSNELNGYILDNVIDSQNSIIDIDINNNSVFAVNILASIEQKNSETYTTSAGLKIAVNDSENITYADSATVSNLTTRASASLLVKPTATSFVNTTGTTASVTGEVNLTFTKSS